MNHTEVRFLLLLPAYQGTFAYDKQLETLVYAAIDPTKYMVLGGTHVLPIQHGLLLQEETVRELISSTTYDRDSFEREVYEYLERCSSWRGIYSRQQLSNLRKVVHAEYKASAPTDLANPHFYVISADMAKDGSARTAVVVWKVKPRRILF